MPSSVGSSTFVELAFFSLLWCDEEDGISILEIEIAFSSGIMPLFILLTLGWCHGQFLDLLSLEVDHFSSSQYFCPWATLPFPFDSFCGYEGILWSFIGFVNNLSAFVYSPILHKRLLGKIIIPMAFCSPWIFEFDLQSTFLARELFPSYLLVLWSFLSRKTIVLCWFVKDLYPYFPLVEAAQSKGWWHSSVVTKSISKLHHLWWILLLPSLELLYL